MKPRKISWYGTLSLGLLPIPVGLDPATNPTAKASNVSFKTIHKTCLTPIKQKKWCPECELELSMDDTGKGYQQAKGEPLVLVDEDELAALKGEKSSDMPISAFVPWEQVDPIRFDRTYYLFPGEKADGYAALLQVMQDTGRCGICHYVRSGQEKIGYLRPLQGIIGMETLFVDEDIRSVSDVVIEYVPTSGDMSIATQLVELLSEDFDSSLLTYDYRERLSELLAPAKPVKKVKVAKVPDMQDVLKQSVAALKAQKKTKKAA